MRAPAGRSLFVATVILLVAAAVVAGLVVIGWPAEERLRRLDRKRVADLTAIAAAVHRYYTQHERLPASLDELAREASPAIAIDDPETAERYEYGTRGAAAYELCAAFEARSDDHPGAGRRVGAWSHEAGRTCFRRDARLDEPR